MGALCSALVRRRKPAGSSEPSVAAPPTETTPLAGPTQNAAPAPAVEVPPSVPAPPPPAEVPPPKPSVAYLWTADDLENTRLDKQHHMLSDIAWSGRPFLAPVESVLGEKGEGKKVLDLGTGSGIWAIDVALRFPEAEVVGIDLGPNLGRSLPKNCRLEVHDLNSGLSKWDNQIDYAHTRLISSGIHDYPSLIRSISSTLQPGGLVELAEWDFRIYTSSHEPRPVVPRGEEGHSYIAEWLWALREMGAQRGGHMDASREMEGWVRGMEEVWEEVEVKDTWICIAGPTGDTPEELAKNRAMHERMKDDARQFVASARPALAKKMNPEYLDDLMTGLMKEIEEGEETLYTRMTVVWARKKEGADVAVPEEVA